MNKDIVKYKEDISLIFKNANDNKKCTDIKCKNIMKEWTIRNKEYIDKLVKITQYNNSLEPYKEFNQKNAELYFLGFLWALMSAIKDFPNPPKMIMMDDVGHLRPIVRKWTESNDVVLRTPCAYYLCNYVVPKSPFREEEVILLL